MKEIGLEKKETVLTLAISKKEQASMNCELF